MAPRFSSGVKIVPGLVFGGFLNAIIRRGYTAEAMAMAMAMAASERVTSTSAAGVLPARSDGVMKKEEPERSTEKGAAWMPDPVTGYYRPESNMNEIDAVDLRAKLLKPRRNNAIN